MTGSPEGDRLTPIRQEIGAIEAQLKANPSDWKIKMRLAEALQRLGHIDEARKLYQEVVEADPGGVFASQERDWGLETPLSTAARSQESGEMNDFRLPKNLQSPIPHSPFSIWRGFCNQPIRRKVFVVLLGSNLISVSALTIASVWWLGSTYQRQILQNSADNAIAYLQNPTLKKTIDEIISQKRPLPKPSEIVGPVPGSYSALYLHNPKIDEFSLVTSRETVKEKSQAEVSLPDRQLLDRALAQPGRIVTGWVKIGQYPYAMAAKALPNPVGTPQPVLVLGTLETQMQSLLRQSLALQMGLTVVVLAIDVLLAFLLAKAIAYPIQQLQSSAQEWVTGDLAAPVPVWANDEIGQLGATLNQLVNLLGASVAAREEEARRHQGEVTVQQREKERLQQGVRQLLHDIAETKDGDLTVRAQVESGELGAIAVSFNATLSSLQEIVIQVQLAANQLHALARNSTQGVQKLSWDANQQASAIATALASVADMGRSMQSIASATLQAAVMARQGVVAAKSGYKMINQTVISMNGLRETVAFSSQKVRILADSSLEISKIVSLISGISERTNILAFNASIAAARAGEQGQVFRVVALEVQRLAERVTDSAKEIEQLVSTIQEGVAQALETMENSTDRVETGTQQLEKTQQTLRKLAGISQNINQLLQSISASTVSQAQSSQQVNQTIQAAAAIAQTTSKESKAVADALSEQVEVAETLQDSVSRFRVEEKGVRKE